LNLQHHLQLKMKIKLSFIILLSTFKYSFCQFYIEGTILDKDSKKAVSYVSIGLINDNSGTTSDNNGNFKLYIPTSRADSLLITCVGYKPKTTEVKKSNDFKPIEIEKDEKTLEAVLINSSTERYFLNKYKRCSNNSYYSNCKVFSQLAQLFESPKPFQAITEITLCTWGKNSSIRLHFYGVNHKTWGVM
jgi:hypothetical protein